MGIKNYLTNIMSPKEWFLAGISSLFILGCFHVGNQKLNDQYQKSLDSILSGNSENLMQSKNRKIVDKKGIPEIYGLLHGYGEDLLIAYQVLLDKGIEKKNIYFSESEKEMKEAFEKFERIGPEDTVKIYMNKGKNLKFSGDFFKK